MASKDTKLVRKAMNSASEYNKFINKQRQHAYVDLQTGTVNYPVGLGRQNTTLVRTNQIGRYPVAILPNQYQDWYIQYTPEELDFLPVNTVLRGPIMRIDELPPVLQSPDSKSDSESCCSSCCSCCDGDS